MRLVTMLIVCCSLGCNRSDSTRDDSTPDNSPQKAEVNLTEVQDHCFRLVDAAVRYHGINAQWPDDMSDLKGTKLETQDPWGQPYQFEVRDGQAVVFSLGPDQLQNTADDITSLRE